MGHFTQRRNFIILSSFLLCLLLLPLECSTTQWKTIGSTSQKDNWCFVKEGCNQNSPSSGWNQGTCSTGKMQSPIDLDVKSYDDIKGDSEIDLTEVSSNYDFTSFTMKNEGKHVELSGFRTASGKPPTFTWPDQGDSIYTLQQLHMHWGPSNDNGSEHSISGRKYAMEMHLIHYKSATGQGTGSGFRDMAEAKRSGSPNALATFAIMFQADSGGSASESLKPLINNLKRVTLRGAKVSVEEGILKVGDMFRVQTKALTYQGSMTTPTCDEVVAWLIFHDPVNIKGEDLEIFRSTVHGMDGKVLKTNRRRIQPSNNRQIGVIKLKQ